jgi:predicted DNA-binding protein (UPF0251 family)
MSPRPKRHRRIETPPTLRGFKPMGIPYRMSREISLHYEEYEAIKLADYKNLSQEEAANVMEVSRPTFTRIYEKARKKVAEAFVEGKTLLIEGGNVAFDKQWYRCNSCNTVFHADSDIEKKCNTCGSEDIEHINESLKQWRVGQGHRHGAGNKRREFCICPDCGEKVQHQPGIPCTEVKCPTCNYFMIREDQ